MTLNSTHRYTNTAVLSIERVEAPVVVTSAELDERLAEVYARTKMRGGMLQGVVGIHERRRWAEGQSFIEGAIAAGRAGMSPPLRPRTLRDALASLRRGGPVDVRRLP